MANHIQRRAVTLQQTLAQTGASVKWVEEENLHLTLLFLGEIDERDVVDVCRAVQEQAKNHAPFEVGAQGLGCFPNLRRPKVVWVGFEEGQEELQRLHDDLEEALLQIGCYRREDRKYTPHLTLGRIKDNHAVDDLISEINQRSGWKAGSCTIKEIVVFSSELSSKGPIYTPLSRTKLQS